MPHLQSLRNSLNIFLVNLRNNLRIRPVEDYNNITTTVQIAYGAT